MMISIVIPVYKAKACLVPLHERLTAALLSLKNVDDYEILLVEDCGHDGSWEIIQELASCDPRVRGAQLSRNFGQHHTITAGLTLCRGDWAIIMDCDLQDKPEEISRLWEKAQEGFDVVSARRGKRRDPYWKRLTSRIYHIVLERLSGLSYDPQVANFRIISRKVIDAYLSMQETSRSFGAQVQWLGFPTAYIDVRHESRHEGKSSYTLRRLVALAVDSIISFSNKPLRFSVGIGLTIFLVSGCLSIYLVIRHLFWSIPVEGWASLMVSLWFLGGMIIANLGILGLYIGKIYDETRRRPIYVIAKKVNLDGSIMSTSSISTSSQSKIAA